MKEKSFNFAIAKLQEDRQCPYNVGTIFFVCTISLNAINIAHTQWRYRNASELNSCLLCSC